MADPRDLHTGLCDLLDCRYPILQAGMGGVARAELAASDRTLAALSTRPRSFAVGNAQAAIATIHPQPHDVAMDFVVSEQDVVGPTMDPAP